MVVCGRKEMSVKTEEILKNQLEYLLTCKIGKYEGLSVNEYGIIVRLVDEDYEEQEVIEAVSSDINFAKYILDKLRENVVTPTTARDIIEDFINSI